MRVFTALLLGTLFMASCGTNQQQTATQPQAYSYDPVPLDDYWARDNFDLQRAGDLLERSDSPEQFERYINEPDGINNLDLNGDGNVDYISVEEFNDRDDHSRGLSLFSRFGPDLIQEIATIFFYRDEPRYPGARIFLRGNDQLYGDNYYYETNWLDRDSGVVTYLFNDRDAIYQSPYYYDNYPTWYSAFPVVGTPVFRTRVVDLYPQPVFVRTESRPEFLERVTIKSPNNGRHLGQIHAQLVNPTRDQAEFIKNNPSRRSFARGDDKPGRDNPPRSDRGEQRGNPARDERGAERGNPNHPAENPNRGGEHPAGGNPNRGGENPNRGGGNPNRGGENPNRGGSNPNHVENPNRGGGNPNKGGGNPNKDGGGGNPNKDGGGGKGGKKP